jgi:chemotaxis response regulator CheB
MRIAIAARGALIQAIRAAGGGGIHFKAGESKELRRLAYMLQPDVLILDELAAPDWKPLASVPRIKAKCKTRVIALLDGITRQKKRMAAMAGCYDGIDLSDSSWPEELAASLEVVRCRLASDAQRLAPVVRLRPRTAPTHLRRSLPVQVEAPRPVLRVVRG